MGSLCTHRDLELHSILIENARVDAERFDKSHTAQQLPANSSATFHHDEVRLQGLIQNLTELSQRLLESMAWNHENYGTMVSASKSLAASLKQLQNRVILSNLAPDWPIASENLSRFAEDELDRSINCLNEELAELKRQVGDLTSLSRVN
jgi:hypothetical protein